MIYCNSFLRFCTWTTVIHLMHILISECCFRSLEHRSLFQIKASNRKKEHVSLFPFIFYCVINLSPCSSLYVKHVCIWITAALEFCLRCISCNTVWDFYSNPSDYCVSFLMPFAERVVGLKSLMWNDLHLFPYTNHVGGLCVSTVSQYTCVSKSSFMSVLLCGYYFIDFFLFTSFIFAISKYPSLMRLMCRTQPL